MDFVFYRLISVSVQIGVVFRNVSRTCFINFFTKINGMCLVVGSVNATKRKECVFSFVNYNPVFQNGRSFQKDIISMRNYVLKILIIK